jgi:hypothetical protein
MRTDEINPAYLDRIIASARHRSFDPYEEIDWEVPFDLSRFYLPQELVSLYGTAMWTAMTREERVRLSLHEAASTLAAGIWFENLLCFKLTDYLGALSPHHSHFYWMQIEVADECRHSMMFGEIIRRAGAPWYRPRYGALFAFFTKHLSPRISVILGALIAEAVTDYLNRRIVEDPECHPAMRELSRIHIIEEARHLGYAREWLKANWPVMGGIRRELARYDALVSAAVTASMLVHPDVYRNCGLPRDARAMARKNPHAAKVIREASADAVRFLTRLGVINPRLEPGWRVAGLMA